jgi:hypothetical protein
MINLGYLYKLYSIRNMFMFSITNMVMVQNVEVISGKFKADGICIRVYTSLVGVSAWKISIYPHLSSAFPNKYRAM